jgi:hypothetical protein
LESVIVSVYEEEDNFELDVFESVNGSKGELLRSGSEYFAQGVKLTDAMLKQILADEIESSYHIEEMEFLEFDDVVVEAPALRTLNKRPVYTFSVGMIERYIRKMIADKYGAVISFWFTLDEDADRPTSRFGKDEETLIVLSELAKEVFSEHVEELEFFQERLAFVFDDDSLAELKENTLTFDFDAFLNDLPAMLLKIILGAPILKFSRDPQFDDVIQVFTA